MELPEINDAIIHARSTSHSYTRGEEYFQSGCVSNLIIEGETAHAIVYGRKRYPVKIWGRGSTIKTACACRYEGEGICRHAVAVMLSIARQNSGQTPFQWYEYGTRTTPPQDKFQQTRENVRTPEPVPAPKPSQPIAQPDLDFPKGALLASEIMSSNIASLTPETTLDEAWGMICEHRFRHIPIVSSEGKLVGIISDRDLLLRAALISASDTVFQEQAGNTIADIMKTQILTATPSTEIHQIARVMFEKKVGAMPILNEHGNLVGMITRSDILRALIRQELSE